MWTLERTQTHPLPSSCVTPQLTLWTSSASWVQSSPRTSSGSWTSTKKAQKRMYCLRQQGTFNLPKKMMVRYKAESPTDTDSYTPIYLHYINALPSSVQFSYLFSSLLTYFFFFFFLLFGYLTPCQLSAKISWIAASACKCCRVNTIQTRGNICNIWQVGPWFGPEQTNYRCENALRYAHLQFCAWQWHITEVNDL